MRLLDVIVARPVPPYWTATGVVRAMFGVAPPVDVIGAVPVTLVTVPPGFVELIEIPPDELVIVTLLPAVRVDSFSPDPLPIRSSPLAGERPNFRPPPESETMSSAMSYGPQTKLLPAPQTKLSPEPQTRLLATTGVSPVPEMYHSVLVTLIAVAMPYCARVSEPLVPDGDSVSVSVVIEMVMLFVELLTKVTDVPTGKATLELSGIVYVVAA